MIRRSISQIFDSNTQQEIRKQQEQRNMFAHLQGKRPMVQPQVQQSPMNQQQMRSNSQTMEAAGPEQRAGEYLSATSSKLPFLPLLPHRPRSQIEALPPSSTSLSAKAFTASQLEEFSALQKKLQRDSSRRHPVFFTDRVRKAPNGVDVGEGVGKGYVFEEGVGRRAEDECRL